MKKYFVYELKKMLAPFLIVLFLGAAFYVFPLQIENTTRFASYVLDNLSNLMVVLGAACAVLPVWLFVYKTGKRSTDLYYSLPMTRTKQLAVRYITGFIAIIAAYTVVYILGIIVTAIRYEGAPNYVYYLALYFSSIIPAYIIYSISSFAFTRANSVIDGIIFIAFAMLALFMVALFISTFTTYETLVTWEYVDDYGEVVTHSYTVTENYVSYSRFFPFTPLDVVTTTFEDLIYGYSFASSNPFNNMGDPEAINTLVSLIIFPIISAACTLGLFSTEKDCKAENCNQVSDSIFGYKVMLPVFTVAACAVLGIDWITGEIVLFLVIIAAIYAGAALYKKSFKIGWKFALVLVAAAVIGIVCGTLNGGIY